MDMKHDFPHDPGLRIDHARATPLLPEAVAIAAIFAAVWGVLALRILSDGVAW